MGQIQSWKSRTIYIEKMSKHLKKQLTIKTRYNPELVEDRKAFENACQILKMKRFIESEQRHERRTMTVRQRPLVAVYVAKTMDGGRNYAFDCKATSYPRIGVVF